MATQPTQQQPIIRFFCVKCGRRFESASFSTMCPLCLATAPEHSTACQLKAGRRAMVIEPVQRNPRRAVAG